MTTFGDIVYQLGGVPVGSGLGSVGLAGGNVFFVNGTGLDAASGKGPDDALKTIAQGYAKTTTNNNDIVILVGDSSGAQIDASTSTGLAWANSYTHLIGACAPVKYAKRARIFHNFNASPVWTISGSGCSFENFYFSHGRGSTDNKIGISLTGDYNYFGNCHLAGPQHATDGNQTSYSVITLNGAASSTFESCIFGSDTTARGNGATSITFAGTNTVGQTWFNKCDFVSRASNAGATHMEVGAAVGLIVIDGCTMINEGTTITQAIDSDIADTTYRKIIVKPPFIVVGATDVADATGDGTIWTERFTATANVIGLAINPAAA